MNAAKFDERVLKAIDGGAVAEHAEAIAHITMAADVLGWNVIVDNGGEAGIVRWFGIAQPSVSLDVTVTEPPA